MDGRHEQEEATTVHGIPQSTVSNWRNRDTGRTEETTVATQAKTR
jgi:hypothetical protein